KRSRNARNAGSSCASAGPAQSDAASRRKIKRFIGEDNFASSTKDDVATAAGELGEACRSPPGAGRCLLARDLSHPLRGVDDHRSALVPARGTSGRALRQAALPLHLRALPLRRSLARRMAALALRPACSRRLRRAPRSLLPLLIPAVPR